MRRGRCGVSAWGEVDELKRSYFKTLRGTTKARYDRSLGSTWHARIVAKCYRYTTTAGEVREWQQHQLAHAHDWRRVEIVGACVETSGPLPALVGARANRLTQNISKLDCAACRVALDGLLERGVMAVDEKGRFHPVDDKLPPIYEMSASARCALCGKNRETCGHFIGGGAF